MKLLLDIFSVTLIIIATSFGIYKAYFELSFVRKRDYDEWEQFKQRQDKIDKNTQLFEKEALLRTVNFLKNFSWYEYEFLMKLNLNLKLIKALNHLKGRNKIHIHSQKIYIHNNIFEYRIHIKDFMKIIFLFYLIWYNFMVYGFYILEENVNMRIIVLSSAILVFILFFIAFHIYTIFNGILAYRFIRKNIQKNNELTDCFEFKYK